MMRFFLILVILPVSIFAQKKLPRYENDTLYTTCGFKMYKGMTLHIGKGSRPDGKFRFINIKSDNTSEQIDYDSVIIRKMKNFGISVLGTAYIEILGNKTFKDGSKGGVDLHIAFERAIESNIYRTPGEIIVPPEFLKKPNRDSVADDLLKLIDLYKHDLITKEEFEVLKQQLMENN